MRKENQNKVQNQLSQYAELVFEANQYFNLTGHKNVEAIYENLVDCVIKCFSNINLVSLGISNVIDIGSGSGSPGIVLAILNADNNIRFTLVESNSKKCLFLEKVVADLSLSNVTILNKRAEELPDSETNKYDLGLSRAVSSIAVMNELLCKYVKLNKFILHLKSTSYQNELSWANQFAKHLNLKLHDLNTFMLDKHFFANVWYMKTSITPKCYPRPWKTIKKDLIDKQC